MCSEYGVGKKDWPPLVPFWFIPLVPLPTVEGPEMPLVGS